LSRNRHDLALVDYRLGAKTGLDCMREARALGSEIPVILLSETDDREIDLAAVAAGAVDYTNGVNF
jgi:DNA-binding response OmpR family regulator